MEETKNILILGIDGYIGFPLALDLLSKGHTISGLDNFSRRKRVAKIGSDSITPIQSIQDRLNLLHSYPNFKSYYLHPLMDLQKLAKNPPDIIIHLAEQPSASYSMISEKEAIETQRDNVLDTVHLLWQMRHHCPNAHLVKLGTMGEYGKPDCIIPEGFIPDKCMAGPDSMIFDDELTSNPTCPLAGLPFPKSPNSFYHLTKVHDTNNIMFACKTWGLSSSDIMQGVLFGLMSDSPELITRFDYDEHFGTVINRFCAQAVIGHPLTIYGSGAQSYSFLPLKDSIKCINLILNDIPQKGEYRVFNQFGEVYSIILLANLVCRIANSLNLKSDISYIPNPRTESEDHIYEPVRDNLTTLGYTPTYNLEEEITRTIKILTKYKDRINPALILPKTNWRKTNE